MTMMTTAQKAINAFSEATPESSASLAVVCLAALRAGKDHGVAMDEVIEIIRLFPTDEDCAKDVTQIAKALVAVLWDEVDNMSTTEESLADFAKKPDPIMNPDEFGDAQ